MTKCTVSLHPQSLNPLQAAKAWFLRSKSKCAPPRACVEAWFYNKILERLRGHLRTPCQGWPPPPPPVSNRHALVKYMAWRGNGEFVSNPNRSGGVGGAGRSGGLRSATPATPATTQTDPVLRPAAAGLTRTVDWKAYAKGGSKTACKFLVWGI